MKADVIYNNSAMVVTVSRQAAPRLRDAAEFLKLLMVASFGLPKSGKPGPFRRRSAPGEAPAIQTGNLFRSIKVTQPSPLIAQVSVDAEYARYLEFGAKHLAERPFARPAIEKLPGRFNSGDFGRFV